MIEAAVILRIKQLCAEHDITVYDLANRSGITPSTLYSLLNGKSKNPGIVTIKKLCDGLDISVIDFFTCSLFKELDQEVK